MSAHKVMLLGEIGVGKSSLVKRLVFDRFETDYKPTLGVDVYRYEVPPSKTHAAITLIIWDTDGNFGEAMFRHVYMKEASAAFIIGDVTRRPTLDTMLTLSKGFREHFPGRYEALIVNKIDLLDGEPLNLPDALSHNRKRVFHTSAMTGDNVQFAFHEAAAEILRRGL
ncbi:MAG TPA: Rab family GTPase [Hyphomicrobiaceae bacterium]|nr:Rab family GTPase [Hyphomicrobiaceae bacterium]